jgi:hypothetical protein
MSKRIDKEGLVISSLLAGAAVYFGLSKKGNSLEDLARVAVNRVIDDQSQPRAEVTNKAVPRIVTAKKESKQRKSASKKPQTNRPVARK